MGWVAYKARTPLVAQDDKRTQTPSAECPSSLWGVGRFATPPGNSCLLTGGCPRARVHWRTGLLSWGHPAKGSRGPRGETLCSAERRWSR